MREEATSRSAMNAKSRRGESEDAHRKHTTSGKLKKPLTTSRAEQQIDRRTDHKVGNPPFNDPSSPQEGVGSLNGGLSTL